MADPLIKTARKSRSRAACLGCRTTKQKCDGPSRIPCRRCQLYGLSCEYPPTTSMIAPSKSTSKVESARSNGANSGPAAAATASTSRKVGNSLPSLGTSGLTVDPSALLDSGPALGPGTGVESSIQQHLADISLRLRSIESALSGLNLNTGPQSQSHQHVRPNNDGKNSNVAEQSTSAGENDLASTSTTPPADSRSALGLQAGDIGHAVQTVADTIGMLEDMDAPSQSMMQTGNEPSRDGSDNATSATAHMSPPSPQVPSATIIPFFGAPPPPDAINGGIMTEHECEISFKIFVRLIGPWTTTCTEYPPVMVLRSTSPLLFHVILLCTSYYLLDSSERGQHIYHALISIVNQLVAPIMVSTQPNHHTVENVEALTLLLLYKPVQHASLWQAGIRDPVRAEHVSKLCSTTGAVIMAAITRTVHAIGLNNAPSIYASPGDIPDIVVLANLRLWFNLLVVDTHASMTTGRPTVLDLNDALKVTRLFASRRAHPVDIRIAAMVELYGVVKPVVTAGWFGSCGSNPINHQELTKFNTDLNHFDEYWQAELTRAAQAPDRDLLGPLVHSLWRNLVKLTVNTSVFARWQQLRKTSTRPVLTQEDWSCLQLALDAAEELIFCLSVESRVPGSHMRQVQWPIQSGNQPRPKLTLDHEMVDAHKTAYDPVACVAYTYPLILVAKMINDGLARSEMTVAQNSYTKSTGPIRPRRLSREAKFGDLLVLGASFLEAIAPTRTHPAYKHARVLKTILAAGTQPFSITTTLGSSNPNVSYPPDAIRPQEELTPPMLPSQARSPVSPSSQSSTTVSAGGSGGGGSGGGGGGGGEVLASILDGLQPTYFGEEALWDGNLSGYVPSLTALPDAMVIDWDSLERTINGMGTPPDPAGLLASDFI